MKTENELRRERRIGLIVSLVLVAIPVSAWLVLKFVTPTHRVPTKAMAPTIHPRDRVMVNRAAYLFGAKPEVGEVATFRSPIDRTLLIKRIVGGPGDTLEMRDNVLFRNGKRVDEPYIMLTPEIPALRSFPRLEVPAGQYFFLGDNRDNSNDSRFIGFVPEDHILGRMVHVFHVGRCEGAG